MARSPSALSRSAFAAAVACGVVGLIANLLLIGFFALTYPFFSGRWGWLGFTNDVVGIGYFALFGPVVLGFSRLLPPSRVLTVATALAVGAVVGLVGLSVALVSGVLSFEAQVPWVIALLMVLHGWLLLACSIGHRLGHLPRSVTRLGMLLGMASPVALVLVLAGLAVGGTSPVTMTFGLPGALLVVPGLALGMVSWLLLPLWPLLLAATVRKPSSSVGPPAARSAAVQISTHHVSTHQEEVR